MKSTPNTASAKERMNALLLGVVAENDPLTLKLKTAMDNATKQVIEYGAVLQDDVKESLRASIKAIFTQLPEAKKTLFLELCKEKLSDKLWELHAKNNTNQPNKVKEQQKGLLDDVVNNVSLKK
ncbi:MAG: hypothetical protein ABI597_06540 [Gammaproteobacteria bacterium]